MPKDEKGFGIVAVALALLTTGLVGFFGWQVSQAKYDNPTPTKSSQTTTPSPTPQTPAADTITITLTNETTGKPIANTKVAFTSDNGLRCESAPCANNKKSWSSTTDANGIIRMPKDNVQAVTRLDVSGYTGTTLTYEAAKTTYKVTLKPE